MSAYVYVEGGGTASLDRRCRAEFAKLLKKCELERMPRLVACGSRANAYKRFQAHHRTKSAADYIVLLVDSEEPVADTEKPWQHLGERDKWSRPGGATDQQVFLMTTCMETWIISDHAALHEHYGHCLQEPALPPAVNIERRPRNEIQDGLSRATRTCSNAYKKGKRSFEILGKLHPDALRDLPSFTRMRRILQERLKPQ